MLVCKHLWVALPSSGGKDEVIVLFFYGVDVALANFMSLIQ